MRERGQYVFKKMTELSVENSCIDMHMHTTWTDGKNTLQEMVIQAEKNGLAEIAITDHIRMESDYYSDYFLELKKIREEHDIKIYTGFEAKIKNIDGEVDIPNDVAKKADFVIASVHRLPVGDVFKYPKNFQYDDLAQLEKQLSIKAIQRGNNIDVLGHCGGMTLATYGKYPLQFFDEIIRACKEYHVVFEFNYKYHYRYEEAIKNLLYIYNPYVSVGSDAHNIYKISKRSFV